mgnify:CR=1 FL=1|tara:strand:- start:381 stop:1010 length:630 start_codon:yes stop_codon:yes gene_type:complete
MKMKLKESELKEIIASEIETMIENGEIDEGLLTKLTGRLAGLGQSVKGKGAELGYKALSKGAGYLPGKAGQKISKDAATAAAGQATATTKAVGVAKAGQVLRNQLGNLNSNYKEMVSDAKSLGVLDMPEVVKAFQQLEKAIQNIGKVSSKMSALGDKGAQATAGDRQADSMQKLQKSRGAQADIDATDVPEPRSMAAEGKARRSKKRRA